MKLTLTRKIFLGYLLMIFLVLVEGTYAVFELNRLNRLSRSMVQGEVVSMDLEKKLIDLFLSQVSSEKKYLVVRDRDFLDLAASKSREFDETLLRLMAGRGRGPVLEGLEAVRERHDRHFQGFLSLLEAEPDGSASGADPAAWGLTVETEVRAITRSIEDLVLQEEVGMARKMGQAQAFSRRAYRITMGILVSMGLFGLLMAWLMVRSVREPIRRLKEGTRYVAEGIFENRIRITSRDEFGELAGAFNAMTRRLAELEEMKREFISNVSHELRTPLTSVKAAAGLMLDRIPGPITEKQKTLLGIIEEEIGKLVRLINNLLDLSRIRAGMMQYHFARADLLSILRTGMDNVRFLSELKGIALELEASEGLPPVLLDSEKIEQVVNNLLSNAVKFTPRGGRIRVRVIETASREGAQGMLRICVEDTGVGIDPDALPGIFERFRQADPLFGSPVKGSGLGLSICKFYVEEHGGRIWGENREGGGSRFCFELPLIGDKEAVEA